MLADPQCDGRFYYLGSASVNSLPSGSGAEPQSLWDLRDVETAYRHIIEQCTEALRGRGPSAQNKRARTLLAARKGLRLAEGRDPMLPVQLLPDDWPRDQALKSIESRRGAVEESLIQVRRRA